MRDWLKYAKPPLSSDTIVALIDPDFIFLRPLSLKLAGEASSIFYRSTSDNIPAFIGEGTPVAQLYGLAAPWVGLKHIKI